VERLFQKKEEDIERRRLLLEKDFDGRERERLGLLQREQSELEQRRAGLLESLEIEKGELAKARADVQRREADRLAELRREFEERERRLDENMAGREKAVREDEEKARTERLQLAEEAEKLRADFAKEEDFLKEEFLREEEKLRQDFRAEEQKLRDELRDEEQRVRTLLESDEEKLRAAEADFTKKYETAMAEYEQFESARELFESERREVEAQRQDLRAGFDAEKAALLNQIDKEREDVMAEKETLEREKQEFELERERQFEQKKMLADRELETANREKHRELQERNLREKLERFERLGSSADDLKRFKELAAELELEQEVVRFEKATLFEKEQALELEKEKLAEEYALKLEKLSERERLLKGREGKLDVDRQRQELDCRFQKQALENARSALLERESALYSLGAAGGPPANCSTPSLPSQKVGGASSSTSRAGSRQPSPRQRSASMGMAMTAASTNAARPRGPHNLNKLLKQIDQTGSNANLPDEYDDPGNGIEDYESYEEVFPARVPGAGGFESNRGDDRDQRHRAGSLEIRPSNSHPAAGGTRQPDPADSSMTREQQLSHQTTQHEPSANRNARSTGARRPNSARDAGDVGSGNAANTSATVGHRRPGGDGRQTTIRNLLEEDMDNISDIMGVED